MTRPRLTDRQAEILVFIDKTRWMEQRPPTRMEISRHFGFKSANAAQDHLEAIARKGYILLKPGAARGIYVLPEPIPTLNRGGR